MRRNSTLRKLSYSEKSNCRFETHSHGNSAARAFVYQEERLRAATRAVSRESQVLTPLLREHRLELMEEPMSSSFSSGLG